MKMSLTLKHQRSILFCLLFFISVIASADNHFRERMYFGLGIATSELKLNDKNIASINNFNETVSLENNTFGAQAFLGFQFDEHVAVELGYSDIGNINLDDGNTTQSFMSVNSSYLDAVLTQAISERFNAFAQAGIAYWSTSETNNQNVSEGNGLHYGVGLDINIFNDKNRMLRVKWENQEFDNILIKSVSSISASILFTF